MNSSWTVLGSLRVLRLEFLLRYLTSFTASSPATHTCTSTPTRSRLSAHCSFTASRTLRRRLSHDLPPLTTTDHIPSSLTSFRSHPGRFNLPISLLAVQQCTRIRRLATFPRTASYNICQTPSGYSGSSIARYPKPLRCIEAPALLSPPQYGRPFLPRQSLLPTTTIPDLPTELTRAPSVPPCPLLRPRTTPPML